MMPGTGMNRESQNKQTALILTGVALVFFVAIVLKYWLAR